MVTIHRKKLAWQDEKSQQEAKKEHFARAHDKLMDGRANPECYKDDGEIDWDKWEEDTNREFNRKHYNE